MTTEIGTYVKGNAMFQLQGLTQNQIWKLISKSDDKKGLFTHKRILEQEQDCNFPEYYDLRVVQEVVMEVKEEKEFEENELFCILEQSTKERVS